jgi:hypothetical protein
MVIQRGHIDFGEVVLEGNPINWHSPAYILKGMLEKIRDKCFSFIWIGKMEKVGIALVRRKKLAKPKEDGRWIKEYAYAWSSP